MLFKEHCARTKAALGSDWAELHRWLDQYADEYCGWHRIILHHAQGIELAVEIFGERAREAVRMHVMDDFEGRIPKGFKDMPWPSQPHLRREIETRLQDVFGFKYGLPLVNHAPSCRNEESRKEKARKKDPENEPCYEMRDGQRVLILPKYSVDDK
ncbi:DUF6915 family protein [Desulfocurvibacter africanus]|uniref:DUF6915 family protein n=1 Tax=Desulfocurvibacter africanus TaxID=873 RepID=UPI000554B6FF|nr:hypothetical protein [Desulfocurvibacter africanus]